VRVDRDALASQRPIAAFSGVPLGGGRAINSGPRFREPAYAFRLRRTRPASSSRPAP